MSEPKRVPLQTLEFPESLGHAGKKDKKGEKGKQLEPSYRFVVNLPESNEKTCPEINYTQLVRDAEKRRRKEQKRGEENSTNGLGPFDDDDDDEKLRDMAKHFEAKYGTSTVDRKKRKYDDYVDLGAGYDENDSFIDNTDAYDEIVPEEMTTAHGGFYINCGALEFKAVDRQPTLHNNNNNNNNSDEDESSESSEEDTEDVDSPKREHTHKRHISSSEEEEETEDITGDHPRKKQKVDENDESKKAGGENAVIKKKKKHHDSEQNSHQDTADGLQRRKEKRDNNAENEGGVASEDADEKKKADKPEGQKSKGDAEKKFDIKKFEKKASNSNGFDGKKLELKKLGGKDRNIDDAIESVVNAARVEDESSRDTTDSAKSRCLGSESECEDVEKEEAPMPDTLSEEDKQIVNQLKAHAENSKDLKGKFFNSVVNTLLCSLEKKLRSRYTPSDRLQTYGHLARFLPCSKIALQNRAKKLHLQEVEYKVREPMQRLKTIIDNVMPAVIDKYVKDCQKVANEKGLEATPVDGESSDEEEANKNPEKSKIPKRRFPWSKETKKLIYEIANARRHYFEVLRPRKETMENSVNRYLETKVLPLFPPGYVDLQTLQKYSHGPKPVIKKKSKKPKDASGESIATTGNTLTNSTITKVDAPSTQSVVSLQERDKQQASISKVQSVTENSTNFVSQGAVKSNDISIEKKHLSTKQPKEKPCQPPSEHQSGPNPSVGKISLVPTAQLMAQKPVKSHVEKFNLMDLANSCLSITPVNDFHKSQSTKILETKKDVVSITPYSETSNILPNTNEVPQSGHHSVHRPESSYPCTTQPQHSSYPPPPSQTSPHSKSASLKHRLLHENTEAKCDKRAIDDKDIDIANKTDKRDKRRERSVDVKQKMHQEMKKRKKEQKMVDPPIGSTSAEIVPIPPQPQPPQPSLSKEEQEQMQNEETIAATNFLSQIINDDTTVRGLPEKRKESGLVIEETIGNMMQPTEQEKDVQMVMRSLKELQELQEMKYSPSHSPVGSSIQKSNKSNAQYVTYQDEYQRLYHKKDDKMRPKEEPQW